MIADCHARRRPLAFLLLDLDHFKQINDRHGHACGDMALAHFADVVSSFLGGRGVFGRIGGEEFGIVLPHHTEEQATALAEDICRIVRETPAGRGHRRIGLTVSIGIAAAAPGDTITDVMIRADLASTNPKPTAATGARSRNAGRSTPVPAPWRLPPHSCGKPMPFARNTPVRSREFRSWMGTNLFAPVRPVSGMPPLSRERLALP